MKTQNEIGEPSKEAIFASNLAISTGKALRGVKEAQERVRVAEENKVAKIVSDAIAKGKEAADNTDDKGSNGSEAFQYVSLTTKKLIKLQNQLKKIDGAEKDFYYGWLITPLKAGELGYGFYKGEAFCEAVAKHLRDNGIVAYALDRLL